MAVAAKATQDFVPIKEVRDGIIVLKDGSMRAIVMASSINFALKSSDEQTAILYQFQNFLNSLDFSVQIFIQSRRRDIRPYINLLEEQYKNQFNNLMKIQIKEYVEFIKSFTERENIMEKRFFLVIPYATPIAAGIGLPFGEKKTEAEKAQEKNDHFAEYRTQLEQRITAVQAGLVRMGLKGVQLGTDAVVELFYKLFNPGDTQRQAPQL